MGKFFRAAALFVAVVLVIQFLPDIKTPARAFSWVRGGTISAGGNTTFAICANGGMWAWGRNASGDLGDGTSIMRSSPVHIMDNVVSVYAGARSSMAIRADNSLWAWGHNQHGVLGTGTRNWEASPVHIMNNVAEVSVGDFHALAVRHDGSLWAWGGNSFGQIGNGTLVYSHFPVQVLDNVSEVSTSGFHHTVARRTDGSVWAWGNNNGGQVGIGTTTHSQQTPAFIMNYDLAPPFTPTPVVPPPATVPIPPAVPPPVVAPVPPPAVPPVPPAVPPPVVAPAPPAPPPIHGYPSGMTPALSNDPNRYGFSFANGLSDFGYTSRVRPIPKSVFQEVWGYHYANSHYHHSINSNWPGNCFGVSVVAQLLNRRTYNINNFHPTAHDVFAIPGPPPTDLLRRIERYQISQRRPAIQNIIMENWSFADNNALEDTLRYIVTNLQNGNSVMVGLYNRNPAAPLFHAHIVSAFAIEPYLNDNDEYVISIYDNNFVGEVFLLHISSNFNTWRYFSRTGFHNVNQSNAIITGIDPIRVMNNWRDAQFSRQITTNAAGGVEVGFGSALAYMGPYDVVGAGGHIRRGALFGHNMPNQFFWNIGDDGQLLLGSAADGEFVADTGFTSIELTRSGTMQVTPGHELDIQTVGITQATVFSTFTATRGNLVILQFSTSFNDALALEKTNDQEFVLTGRNISFLDMYADGIRVVSSQMLDEDEITIQLTTYNDDITGILLMSSGGEYLGSWGNMYLTDDFPIWIVFAVIAAVILLLVTAVIIILILHKRKEARRYMPYNHNYGPPYGKPHNYGPPQNFPPHNQLNQGPPRGDDDFKF